METPNFDPEAYWSHVLEVAEKMGARALRELGILIEKEDERI